MRDPLAFTVALIPVPKGPFPTPCSPNPACGSPAPGSPVGPCASHTERRAGSVRKPGGLRAPPPVLRSCTASPALALSGAPPGRLRPDGIGSSDSPYTPGVARVPSVIYRKAVGLMKRPGRSAAGRPVSGGARNGRSLRALRRASAALQQGPGASGKADRRACTQAFRDPSPGPDAS